MTNRLDKFTTSVGWILWMGLYVLGIGAFFAVLEAFSPMAAWKPWTWNLGTWLIAASLTLILSVGYTLLMLLFVYGVKGVIKRWQLKEQKLRSATEKPLTTETKPSTAMKIEAIERDADKHA